MSAPQNDVDLKRVGELKERLESLSSPSSPFVVVGASGTPVLSPIPKSVRFSPQRKMSAISIGGSSSCFDARSFSDLSDSSMEEVKGSDEKSRIRTPDSASQASPIQPGLPVVAKSSLPNELPFPLPVAALEDEIPAPPVVWSASAKYSSMEQEAAVIESMPESLVTNKERERLLKLIGAGF